MEQVRLWRPPDHQRILAMHGITTGYRVDPVGEYVFGVIDRRSQRVSRGRAGFRLHPGDLAIWDPSAVHTGTPLDAEPWEYRLLIMEIPELVDGVGAEDWFGPDLEFPEPVIRDPRMVSDFRALHAAMDRPASTLERQSLLTTWLQELLERSPSARRRRRRKPPAQHDQALRRAREFLGDNLAVNVTLDELADAAGTSKFGLVRLFRQALGLPPHAFQVGQRVRLARRLLENGLSTAQVAARSGLSRSEPPQPPLHTSAGVDSRSIPSSGLRRSGTGRRTRPTLRPAPALK